MTNSNETSESNLPEPTSGHPSLYTEVAYLALRALFQSPGGLVFGDLAKIVESSPTLDDSSKAVQANSLPRWKNQLNTVLKYLKAGSIVDLKANNWILGKKLEGVSSMDRPAVHEARKASQGTYHKNLKKLKLSIEVPELDSNGETVGKEPHILSHEDVLKGLEAVIREGVRKGRFSSDFYVEFDGWFLPPKYVLVRAIELKTNRSLGSVHNIGLNGGEATNGRLTQLGFEIGEPGRFAAEVVAAFVALQVLRLGPITHADLRATVTNSDLLAQIPLTENANRRRPVNAYACPVLWEKMGLAELGIDNKVKLTPLGIAFAVASVCGGGVKGHVPVVDFEALAAFVRARSLRTFSECSRTIVEFLAVAGEVFIFNANVSGWDSQKQSDFAGPRVDLNQWTPQNSNLEVGDWAFLLVQGSRDIGYENGFYGFGRVISTSINEAVKEQKCDVDWFVRLDATSRLPIENFREHLREVEQGFNGLIQGTAKRLSGDDAKRAKLNLRFLEVWFEHLSRTHPQIAPPTNPPVGGAIAGGMGDEPPTGSVKDLINLLAHNPNLLLMGPPGTGKTYYTSLLAKSSVYGGDGEKRNDKRVKQVQFHPAYAYEDFMEGLRPTPAKDEKSVAFSVKNGVFKQFCLDAAKAYADWIASGGDPDQPEKAPKYLFIIDEINRGNVPKLMGELMLCLEKDKRRALKVVKATDEAGKEEKCLKFDTPDKEAAADGVVVTLGVSGEPFAVPPNVHVVGTMNTSDRSIAMLDVALRRRFGFYEVTPKTDLAESFEIGTKGSGVAPASVMTKLNERIKKKLGRHHELGHSYFMGLGEVKDNAGDPVVPTEAFRVRWYTQILPLLDEYFQGRPEDLFFVLSGNEWREAATKAKDAKVASGPTCPFANVESGAGNSYRLERLDVRSFADPKNPVFAAQLQWLFTGLPPVVEKSETSAEDGETEKNGQGQS